MPPGPVKIIDRPAHYPGRTVWGDSAGPVAYMGECVAGNEHVAGTAVYLNRRESAQLVLAWGWHTEEQYQELHTQHAEAAGRVAELEAELAAALANQTPVVSLREALKAANATPTRGKTRSAA